MWENLLDQNLGRIWWQITTIKIKNIGRKQVYTFYSCNLIKLVRNRIFGNEHCESINHMVKCSNLTDSKFENVQTLQNKVRKVVKCSNFTDSKLKNVQTLSSTSHKLFELQKLKIRQVVNSSNFTNFKVRTWSIKFEW